MSFIEDTQHNKWQVYNGALICHQLPYDNIRTCESELKGLLRRNKCRFARWTSDYDCEQETEWWYCIKEAPVSLESLSAKQRYRVKKGLNNIHFFIITGELFELYKEDLWETLYRSIEDYPAKYRPVLNKERELSGLLSICKSNRLWGGVSVDDNHLCCFAFLKFYEDVAFLSEVKVHPLYLNKEVNAGLAYSICDNYINQKGYRYIVDGERNIRHETNYQKFLINNLGFRNAYCKLNIVYLPHIRFIVSLLYPFRNLIKGVSNRSPFLYNVYCALKQEECRLKSE